MGAGGRAAGALLGRSSRPGRRIVLARGENRFIRNETHLGQLRRPIATRRDRLWFAIRVIHPAFSSIDSRRRAGSSICNNWVIGVEFVALFPQPRLMQPPEVQGEL